MKIVITIKNTLLVIVSMLLFNAQTFAANVELEWKNPENYTDLSAVDMRQEAFESIVFRELGEQFEKSADRFLEENQTLVITVTNVDLAGRVEYNYSNNLLLRLLRGHDFPAMSFTYEIKDENDLTILSGEDRIRALNLKSINKRRYIGNSLHNERSLINDWFVENF